MSPPPSDDEPAGASGRWQPQGSLDADGRLEGVARRPELRPLPPQEEVGPRATEGIAGGSGTPAPSPGVVAAEELELAPHRRRHRADVHPTAPSQASVRPLARSPARPRPWLALALLVGVALVGLTVVRAGWGSRAALATLVRDPAAILTAPAKGVVTITSIPSGATVKVDGLELGTTPWAGDNVWGREVEVELTRRGHRPWRGKLSGGPDVQIRAKLQRGR